MKNIGIFYLIWLKFWVQKNLRKKFCSKVLFYSGSGLSKNAGSGSGSESVLNQSGSTTLKKTVGTEAAYLFFSGVGAAFFCFCFFVQELVVKQHWFILAFNGENMFAYRYTGTYMYRKFCIDTGTGTVLLKQILVPELCAPRYLASVPVPAL
jgi:hypothetical protein